jgi:hypothetical protein
MALTLLEAAKLAANSGEVKRAGVIAMFAEQSAWLRAMNFINIAGNSYAYNQEAALAGVAFRGIGESYTESTGIINPLSEALRISGGDLDVDKFILDTQGQGVRARHEAMKVKGLAAAITTAMIKGSSETNPREFDGLQVRVTGSQLIGNGSTSGGDPLSLAKLDEAIEAVPGANVIMIPRPMRLRFTALMRNQTLTGNVMLTPDALGRPQLSYAGIPLLAAYPENDGVDPITFTEAGPGGGSTSASIYVARIGDGYLSMIQNGTINVRDLGELPTAPVFRTRVDWNVGLVVEHGRAVSRLWGVSNAAIVA